MRDDLRLIKENLDRLYNEYNFSERINHDPIQFPHKYTVPEDVEMVAFIASSFAYGKIDLFMPVIEKILNNMGKNPYDFIINFNIRKHRKLFSGISYRFSSNEDIISLLYVLHKVLQEYGSLETLFKLNFSKKDENVGKALTGFINAFLKINLQTIRRHSQGFRHFFPPPAKGSSCKRLNLFLRWMVRDKDIDLGIWKGVPKNKLVIPLDTHIAWISRCLGFTKRKSADWMTAVEITESLKYFDYKDPLKYDFVLCHLGVTKVCSELRCRECSLFSLKNCQ